MLNTNTLRLYFTSLFTQEKSIISCLQWRWEHYVNKFSEALVDFSLCTFWLFRSAKRAFISFIYTSASILHINMVLCFRLCFGKVLSTAMQLWMYFVLSQFKWTFQLWGGKERKSFIHFLSLPRSCALKARYILLFSNYHT